QGDPGRGDASGPLAELDRPESVENREEGNHEIPQRERVPWGGGRAGSQGRVVTPGALASRSVSVDDDENARRLRGRARRLADSLPSHGRGGIGGASWASADPVRRDRLRRVHLEVPPAEPLRGADDRPLALPGTWPYPGATRPTSGIDARPRRRSGVGARCREHPACRAR